MSRSTQFVGLNEKARKFLDLNGNKLQVVCESTTYNRLTGITTQNRFEDTRIDIMPCERYSWEGMFDDGDFLDAYRLNDGSIVYEKVQNVVWSSGPVIYTAICNEKDVFITETLWDDEDMED